jgi:hypothetical protein
MCLVQFIFGSQYEVSWFLEGYVDANATGVGTERRMTGLDLRLGCADRIGFDLIGTKKERYRTPTKTKSKIVKAEPKREGE